MLCLLYIAHRDACVSPLQFATRPAIQGDHTRKENLVKACVSTRNTNNNDDERVELSRGGRGVGGEVVPNYHPLLYIAIQQPSNSAFGYFQSVIAIFVRSLFGLRLLRWGTGRAPIFAPGYRPLAGVAHTLTPNRTSTCFRCRRVVTKNAPPWRRCLSIT